jgi:hypothetical protein
MANVSNIISFQHIRAQVVVFCAIPAFTTSFFAVTIDSGSLILAVISQSKRPWQIVRPSSSDNCCCAIPPSRQQQHDGLSSTKSPTNGV